MNDSTSVTLDRAADLIEELGWAQVEWDSGTGLCLEGAIMAATGVDTDHFGELWACPAYNAVADYLGFGLDGGPHLESRGHRAVFRYNDAAGRTALDVVALLRACAVIEASRERQSVSS